MGFQVCPYLLSVELVWGALENPKHNSINFQLVKLSDSFKLLAGLVALGMNRFYMENLYCSWQWWWGFLSPSLWDAAMSVKPECCTMPEHCSFPCAQEFGCLKSEVTPGCSEIQWWSKEQHWKQVRFGQLRSGCLSQVSHRLQLSFPCARSVQLLTRKQQRSTKEPFLAAYLDSQLVFHMGLKGKSSF